MRKAALALVVLATGCGSDSGPTREDFIARADAICRQASADREALQREGLRFPPPGDDYVKIVTLIRRLEARDRAALAQLRALDPPPADATEVKTILDGYEDAWLNIAPFITAAEHEDDEEGEGPYSGWITAVGRAQTAAAEYGLKDCSTFGNP